MPARKRMNPSRRPSPALIVAIIALVVACAGTAVAARLITSAQIKDHTIKLRDVSRKAQRILRARRGPTGPRGARGADGATGQAGPTGPQGPSALDGGSIPSGTTITGAWGGRYVAPLDLATQQNSYLLAVSFPLPAPVALTDANVNMGAGTTIAGDADAACDGSVGAPTAPAGKVCIYVNQATRSNTTLTGFKLAAAGGATDADKYGFEVRLINEGSSSATLMRAEGTWAYTAP